MIKHFALVLALLVSSPVLANEDTAWIEGYNRGVFKLNYELDKYILKPVAKGYRTITTQDIRNRVTSVLANIREPSSAGNHLLQGGFTQSMKSIGRFLINSTLGLGGTFDVAEGWGLPKASTNFDDTMAHWCIPDGPFFMLPLIGPTTPRALVGDAVEGIADPVYWATYKDANVDAKIGYSYAVIKAVSARERAIEFLDDLEKNSVDFYTATKSMYIQNRQGMNNICNPVTTPSYDFDFEEEDY